MTRSEALGILGALWDADTDIGSRLLIDVVSGMGYEKALTDDALIWLAERQRGEEQRLLLSAENRRRDSYY